MSVYFFSDHCQLKENPDRYSIPALLQWPWESIFKSDSLPPAPFTPPPTPLSLAQSVVIPRGCDSSLCTRLLNSSWLFPEWKCTHTVISGQFQQSHQHRIPRTKLTPAAFPEMRVCFGLLWDLSFTGFFRKRWIFVSLFSECYFLLTEHVSVEMPVLKGHQSVPMMHFKSHYATELYFFIQMDFG